MNTENSIFLIALSNLLIEIFDGLPTNEAKEKMIANLEASEQCQGRLITVTV